MKDNELQMMMQKIEKEFNEKRKNNNHLASNKGKGKGDDASAAKKADNATEAKPVNETLVKE